MTKKYLQLAKVLKKLLFDREMKAVDLARKTNIPAPTIHRLLTGKSTRPYKSSLKPIADFFSITIDQLIGKDTLTSNPSDINGDSSAPTKKILYIPLIPWNKIKPSTFTAESKYETPPFVCGINENDYSTILPDFSMEPIIPNQGTAIFEQKKEIYEKIPFIGNIHANSYATILPDFSMEPVFPHESMLIFDPEKSYKDRSYVLVQLSESTSPVFRQLLIDLDQMYLKPLNPDLKMRELGKNDKIIGTLIEARQIYSETE